MGKAGDRFRWALHGFWGGIVSWCSGEQQNTAEIGVLANVQSDLTGFEALPWAPEQGGKGQNRFQLSSTWSTNEELWSWKHTIITPPSRMLTCSYRIALGMWVHLVISGRASVLMVCAVVKRWFQQIYMPFIDFWTPSGVVGQQHNSRNRRPVSALGELAIKGYERAILALLNRSLKPLLRKHGNVRSGSNGIPVEWQDV